MIMRKKTFSLVGLILIGVSVFAQYGPDLTDPRSAKVVFTQDFEQSWEEWTTTPIDQITQLEYYSNTGNMNSSSFTPWNNSEEWQRGLFRTDSVITIYKGNMMVIEDYESRKDMEEWGDNDPSHWTIVDDPDNNERIEQFNAFGESDGGGEKYFRFISDTILKNASYSGSYSNKLAARYRRNLFVHLGAGDIEENSSYRLTFYVKAKTLPGHEGYVATPTVYADVMRGYYHAEKPFSMGYISNSTEHPYEYNTTFEYTKNDFYQDTDWDNWEKVTFMTYYTTDSIAENYFYSNGYWWAESGDWLWRGDAPGNPIGSDLRYIVQPDKYMVRLGFPADYTEYCVDNISISKSWIGGCEYYGDKMRVDFGYETNLSQLVKEELARTGLDLLEIDGNYFQVWCQNQNDDWFVMPIRSAEYHSDGYMYLFTDFYLYEDEIYSYKFGDFKQVLVSFQNPTDDPRLTLKYSGVTFPKANNIEWIQNGKIVPDFVNEIAVPNPSPMIWSGVYSKYDLPPVLLEAPYEDGSFGLEPVNEMKFKFSREVLFDNKELSEKAIAYVNDERWNISYDPYNDSILLITRPNGQNLAEGDYVIELRQLQGFGTDFGNNVVVHYNFGEVNRNLEDLNVVTLWDSRFNDENINPVEQCLPEGTALLVHTGNSWSGYKDVFSIGDGYVRDSNCRLYWYEGKYNRAFSLNGRGSGKPASLYLGFEEGFEINLDKGDYNLNYAVVGVNKLKETQVYIYKWDEDWTINPQSIKYLTEANKVLISSFIPSEVITESVRNNNQEQLDIMEEMNLGFRVEESGRYVIEFMFNNTSTEWLNYSSILLSNITVTSALPLSYRSIKALNNAVDVANERIYLANESYSLYGGDILDMVVQKRDFYNPDGGFSQPYPTAPSKWTEAKEDLAKSTRWLKERMDTVDALQAKIADANNMYCNIDETYRSLEAAFVLKALIDTVTSSILFPITEKSGSEIYTEIAKLDDAIASLSNRVYLNQQFIEQLERGWNLYAAGEYPEYEEYGEMNSVLNEAAVFDHIAVTDNELIEETSLLKQTINNYDFKVGGLIAKTRRIRALADLAEQFEVVFPDSRDIYQQVYDATDDDDNLADILKAAIKIALYESILSGDDIDELDLTPFMKNYNLYATPIINNPDDEPIKDNGNILSDAEIITDGAQIQMLKHRYTEDVIWSLLVNREFDNLYPGWTVLSYNTGNKYVSPEDWSDYVFSYLSQGCTAFDGMLCLDWNSKADLKTIVEDLPVGIYSIGVNCYSNSSSNNTSATLMTTNSVNGEDIVNSAISTNNGPVVLTVDDIFVLDGKMNVDFSYKASNGFAKADNFFLKFSSDENLDYEYELQYAYDELEALLNGTAVIPHDPQSYDPIIEPYRIYMEDVSVNAGNQMVIPIKMKNRGDITAFSLDIDLPSGISFVDARLANERCYNHSLSSSVNYNWNYCTVSIACMSTSNEVFYDNDGTIVYLTVDVSNDIEGVFNILLYNVEMTAIPIMKFNPRSYTGNVSVSIYVEPGDVYEDGSITITDAVGIVAFIINSDTQGLNRRAADANQDGVIDVSDVVWVVNKVISRYYAPRRGPAATVIPSTLTLDYSVTGNKMSIPVRIEGLQNEITAAQFSMILPEGISLSGVTTDDNHMVFLQKQEDGTYMIACISLSNSTFSSGDEAALTLDFELSKSFDDAEEVLLNNIILATPDGHKTYIDSVICRISSEGGETGICGIGADSDTEKYDIQGRATDNAYGIYIQNGQKRIQMR